MITAEDIQRLMKLTKKDKDAFYKLLEGTATITAEDIQRLVLLKALDKEMFYRFLEHLKHTPPFDMLLSYKKFKDYAPNV